MNILFKDQNGNIISEAKNLNEVKIEDTIIIQLAEPIFRSQQDLMNMMLSGKFNFPRLKIEIKNNSLE